MIGKKVRFKPGNGHPIREGIVMDKVNVPIASGHNEYCPMDNYVIKSDSSNIYIVNPIFIDSIIE